MKQQNVAANRLNLSTVSTFFSAVTATMIQFSYGQTDTIIANTVNGCWFISLVLSISSVISSVLAVNWMQAM